ncbi:MAG: alpha-1,4-glucan--maltose-1-phosphate maltosyltransferase [Gemmatimonadaceae bacterium]
MATASTSRTTQGHEINIHQSSTPESKHPTGTFQHIIIQNVSPEVDGGRFPVKRLVDDVCLIEADIFKEGHDLLRARLRYRGPGESDWRYSPMSYDPPNDRWAGSMTLTEIGCWHFGVDSWTDLFGTWRAGFEKKVAAHQDVSVELREGAILVDQAADRVKFGEARRRLDETANWLRNSDIPSDARSKAALSDELRELMEIYAPTPDLTTQQCDRSIVVDRRLGGFAAWYELFPRSESRVAGKHGTFADAEERLPRIAELGFDVVYLPPIHPIGYTFRKGRNNSLEVTSSDVGSPWAIGNEAGGHTAVDPNLGTLDDFDRFVNRARSIGLEVALDYALQCSPDHPWVREHPGWFVMRPDGSIQYAENPPKKYQDIFPLDFWCEDREALWNACRDILLFWIARGVRTFRVDNPHTKPFAFWEWIISDIKSAYPDVIFLAEAFTRPKRLVYLAKLGFTQSYTYFTWKNTVAELRQWVTEFSDPQVLEYYRGNLFANTPDILHEYLQTGGPPAFLVRLLLAATLSPLYGIYSGFELCENVPVQEGSEEYHDSEKYQIRLRNYDAPGNLNDQIALLNGIRRSERALQLDGNLTFHPCNNPNILFFHKKAPPGSSDLLVVVNVDPLHAQEGTVDIPLAQLGLAPNVSFDVEDLLTRARYTWRGTRNYVRLDPTRQAGHVLKVLAPEAATPGSTRR